MDQVELLRQWSAATIENAALKAEVAGLKTRLTDAHDKIASLQQFLEGETHMRRTAQAALEAANSAADCALKAQESTRSMLEHFQGEAETFRKELMRRGADDPWKAKPPCDTAFAALQVVCKWDREECLEDLRKQRAEHLRRIDALRSGRELQMDDVAKAMNEDNGSVTIKDFDASLHYVLRELREQISTIFDTLQPETAHEEWFKFPLSTFMLNEVSGPGSDMEDDESMESE